MTGEPFAPMLAEPPRPVEKGPSGSWEGEQGREERIKEGGREG